jgi:hypothetical protein
VFSQPEFKKFSADHVMFLNIMTSIPGYPRDQMLREVDGRGFPHLVVLDRDGAVIGKPAGRTVAALQAAMEDAPPPKPAGRTETTDRAAQAMEFLRRIKLGEITDSPEDRTAYLACRSAMNPRQHKLVEQKLGELQHTAAKAALAAAAPGSAAHTKAAFAARCAEARSGIKSEPALEAARTKAESTLSQAVAALTKVIPGAAEHEAVLLQALEARAALGQAWLRHDGAGAVLRDLLNRAEAERDAHLFATWLADLDGLPPTDAGGASPDRRAHHQARLDRLQNGVPPLRL